MSKVSTYDIRGKKILSRKDKYYLADLGLGQILNTNKRTQYGAYLENIVYNELIFRGYNVSVGNNNGREIDFIATKHNIKEYYQVTFDLSNKETETREFSAYDNIDDNYPKYVISMDKLDYSQNGIIHKNIIDFLKSTIQNETLMNMLPQYVTAKKDYEDNSKMMDALAINNEYK